MPVRKGAELVDRIGAIGRSAPAYYPVDPRLARRAPGEPTAVPPVRSATGAETRDDRDAVREDLRQAASDPRAAAKRQESEAGTEVTIERREGKDGAPDINVVTVLNRATGQPIYQSPPEGVLVMLESALWRLRKKEADDR